MIQTHICPDCQTFLVAADLTDMVLLRASHHCASRQDRNRIHAFDVEAPMMPDQPVWVNEELHWLNLLTIEDARLLQSMGIDPL